MYLYVGYILMIMQYWYRVRGIGINEKFAVLVVSVRGVATCDATKAVEIWKVCF